MKASSPSLTVAQDTMDIYGSENPKEVAEQQARLAIETIISFDAHASDDRAPTTSYELPVSTGAAYLSDFAIKHIRERHGI